MFQVEKSVIDNEAEENKINERITQSGQVFGYETMHKKRINSFNAKKRTQCYKCYEFGHKQSQCKNTKVLIYTKLPSIIF